jgi:hypothetical protein
MNPLVFLVFIKILCVFVFLPSYVLGSLKLDLKFLKFKTVHYRKCNRSPYFLTVCSWYVTYFIDCLLCILIVLRLLVCYFTFGYGGCHIIAVLLITISFACKLTSNVDLIVGVVRQSCYLSLLMLVFSVS